MFALLSGAIGVTVAQLMATSSSAVTSPGIVTGPGQGGGPDVEGFSGTGVKTGPAFFAYDGGFFGGVRVASADINGDGIDDIITGAGPGGGPHVKIFDGATGATLNSFFAFEGSFTGGIFVAAGDINGDGTPDVIVGRGPGAGPEVKVFSGAGGAVIADFAAFATSYSGGVTVASGDVNGDGRDDVVAGSATSDSVVNAFSGGDGALLKNFTAYPGYGGGIFVGAGDVTGDGKADIITGAGPGGGPHVKVFNAIDNSLTASFFAYDAGFHGGVRVAGSDVNGDGKADVITGPGPGGGPHTKAFSGADGSTLASFFAYNAAFAGGVYPTGHTVISSGAPKVTSTTPNTVGQGATAKDVTIVGSGFTSGTTAAFAGGTGIGTNGITVNGTPTLVDPQHLKVNITIAAGATVGPRNVTVTRPDTQTASCTGCFTVSAGPTVGSASPNTGSQGATVANVNIGGTGFVTGAAASFSGTGITVNSTTFTSPTQVVANITIASSAPVGNRDVIVTNPDGGSGKFVGGFGVTAGPQIVSIAPSSVNPPATGTSAPTQIVITGTGFVSPATTAFSGTGITVTGTTVDSATQVTATITVDSTAPHGARNVTVTNTGTTAASSCTGCFSIGAEPTIASVTPNQRGAGTTNQNITIKGTNLLNASVAFTPAGVIVNGTPTNPGGDPTTLVANVSVSSNATPGARDVTVTNASSSVACTGCFTVTAKPTVTSSSPAVVGQGATKDVTVTGSGFQDPANLGYGTGITVTNIKTVSSTQITATIAVASDATTGARDVFVVNVDGGTGTCSACFTVNGAPTVTSVTPATRAAGSAPVDVVIAGTGFGGNTVPSFSGGDVTVNNFGTTDATHIHANITVKPGAPAGTRTVTATNIDGGVGSCANCFTVVAGPVATSVTPSSLNAGDSGKTLTIHGSGFQVAPAAAPTVTFSGTGITYTAPAVVTDANTITLNGVAVAAGSTGVRDVTVTNPDGGVGTCSKCFSIGPLPTVSGASPSSTAVGTTKNINVTGTNFVSGATVAFAPATGITVNGTPTFNNESSLTVNITVAGNTPAGAKDITVTNPAGAHAGSGTCTGCFTVNAAPTIGTLSPTTLKQGQTADVTVNGGGFQTGVASNFGAGVTVNSTTLISASQLKANLTVGGAAALGARDVVVSNPDGGAVTCSSCFGVTAGP